jgi:hypothetical protein
MPFALASSARFTIASNNSLIATTAFHSSILLKRCLPVNSSSLSV